MYACLVFLTAHTRFGKCVFFGEVVRVENEKELCAEHDSADWVTLNTCENSPLPINSTFWNLEVKLASTSTLTKPPKGAMLDRRPPNFARYSREAVGVAGGTADALLLPLVPGRMIWPSPWAEMDRPLGSGGKMLSWGVWGDNCSYFSWSGLAGERGLGLATIPKRRREGTVRDFFDNGDGDVILRNERDCVKDAS